MDENTEVETEVEVDDVTSEVDNDTEVEVEVPAPFKAWELKPKESVSKSIPYDRFSEVLGERDLHARRSQELEAEVARLKEPLTKKQEATLADIKLEDFTNPQDYIQAVALAAAKAEAGATREEIRKELIDEQNGKVQNEHFTQIKDTYQTNLNRSFESNPEIIEAVKVMDKYSEYIHPDIAYELMIDENAGELMHMIATDKDLFNDLFKGNPQDFIRKLHKMSARIERSTSNPEAPVRREPSARDLVKKTIPTSVRPVPGKPSRDPAKMSIPEYRAYVANGYK